MSVNEILNLCNLQFSVDDLDKAGDTNSAGGMAHGLTKEVHAVATGVATGVTKGVSKSANVVSSMVTSSDPLLNGEEEQHHDPPTKAPWPVWALLFLTPCACAYGFYKVHYDLPWYMVQFKPVITVSFALGAMVLQTRVAAQPIAYRTVTVAVELPKITEEAYARMSDALEEATKQLARKFMPDEKMNKLADQVASNMFKLLKKGVEQAKGVLDVKQFTPHWALETKHSAPGVAFCFYILLAQQVPMLVLLGNNEVVLGAIAVVYQLVMIALSLQAHRGAHTILKMVQGGMNIALHNVLRQVVPRDQLDNLVNVLKDPTNPSNAAKIAQPSWCTVQ